MLVLTRKLGEEIVIGDGVRITVVAIRGDRARVGIQAPQSVTVRRAELDPRTVPHRASPARVA